jgi:hypothetical protein
MDGLLAGIPMAGAILVLGVFLGFLYKRPLFDWLNRVKQVKSGDTTIDMSAQAVEQQASANKPTATSSSAGLATPAAPAALPHAPASAAVAVTPNSTLAANTVRGEALRNYGTSPVIIQREAEIRRDLLNVPESERETVLVRHLAVAQLEWKAEEVYRLIFGSQFALLHHLNIYGPEPEQRLIELFVDTAAAQYPEAYARLNRAGYFDYLVNTNLVRRSSDSDGTYAIADLGKAFLEWIPAKGILINKPF